MPDSNEAATTPPEAARAPRAATALADSPHRASTEQTIETRAGKATERLIAFGALLVSIVALGLSFYTIYLQRQEVERARSMILQASLLSKRAISVDELSNVGFEAIGTGITLQRLRIVFPSQIEPEPVIVLPPFKAYLLRPLQSLGATLRQAVPHHPPNEPFAYLLGGQPIGLWSVQDGMPVIIETEYTSRGELLKDRSLYDFEFVEVLPPGGKPRGASAQMPQFTDLRFLRHLGQEGDPASLVDGLMSAKKFAFK
jgi:hypothetical protein